MPLVIGIDLGTTNSLVASMDGDQPRVIPGPDGSPLLPSVVMFTPEGPVVGADAKRRLLEDPEHVVYSVKRLMGKGLADVAADRALLPYRLSDEHREVVRILMDGREYTPPEISAMILRQLKRRAETFLGEGVRDAVITVPAYFNDSQRQATKDAGRLAGLEVLRILNEPTAASLAYGLDKRREGTIAVYDLGGGTFDISILKVQDGIFEVLSTNGDTHLGGDDMDRQLAGQLLAEVEAGGGTRFPVNLEFQERLRVEAEEAKRRLTEAAATTILLPLPDGSKFRRELTRSEFEALIGEIVERTMGPCRSALADAELTATDLDEVVLVGGATRVPLVRRRVEELFGQRPHTELNPDEVVALGAAIQAGILAGSVQNMLLLDITPLSLGLETAGGAVEKLIHRNSTIPTSATQMFTTSVDGQTAFDLHVVQGEREMAADNRSLARFQLRGIDPMPAGMPRLDVTFLIDANGILDVAAHELRSGREASIEVKPSYGLTDEEIERMLMESFDLAEEDLARRQLVDARVEADQVLLATEKLLPDAAEFVREGQLTGNELAHIRTALAALQEARKGDDHRAIRRRVDELDQAARKLAELAMDRVVKQVLVGKEV
jgi:Fe-S protein assembly chaperone HscA